MLLILFFFFPVNLSFIIGARGRNLSQEPRRVEGKLFFLPDKDFGNSSITGCVDGSNFPTFFPGNKEMLTYLKPPFSVLNLELLAMMLMDILKKSFPGPSQMACVDCLCFDRFVDHTFP